MLYKRSEEVFECSLDNSVIIFHAKHLVYYRLTLVGKEIWERLKETKGVDELVCDLVTIYNIDREGCTVSVKNFLAELSSLGLVESTLGYSTR